MRNIRFRAWGVNEGRMIYDYPDSMLMGERDKFARAFNSQNYFVMQFTGLLDRNSKEIYEGDIVKDKFDHISSVEFDPKDGGWRLCHATFPSDTKIISWGLDECEVIGNIYEGLHSHLLDTKTEKEG